MNPPFASLIEEYNYTEDVDDLSQYSWPMPPSMVSNGSCYRKIKYSLVCDVAGERLMLPFPFLSADGETNDCFLLLGSLLPLEKHGNSVNIKAAITDHLIEISESGKITVMLWVRDHEDVWYRLNRPYNDSYKEMELVFNKRINMYIDNDLHESILENPSILTKSGEAASLYSLAVDDSYAHHDHQDNTAIEYFVQGVAVFEPERPSSSSSLPTEETIRANVRINVSRCELHVYKVEGEVRREFRVSSGESDHWYRLVYSGELNSESKRGEEEKNENSEAIASTNNSGSSKYKEEVRAAVESIYSDVYISSKKHLQEQYFTLTHFTLKSVDSGKMIPVHDLGKKKQTNGTGVVNGGENGGKAGNDLHESLVQAPASLSSSSSSSSSSASSSSVRGVSEAVGSCGEIIRGELVGELVPVNRLLQLAKEKKLPHVPIRIIVEDYYLELEWSKNEKQFVPVFYVKSSVDGYWFKLMQPLATFSVEPWDPHRFFSAYRFPSEDGEDWKHITNYLILDKLGRLQSASEIADNSSMHPFTVFCNLCSPPGVPDCPVLKFRFSPSRYSIDFGIEIDDPNGGLWLQTKSGSWFKVIDPPQDVFFPLAEEDNRRISATVNLYNALLRRDPTICRFDEFKGKWFTDYSLDEVAARSDDAIDPQYIRSITEFVKANISHVVDLKRSNRLKQSLSSELTAAPFVEQTRGRAINEAENEGLENSSEDTADFSEEESVMDEDEDYGNKRQRASSPRFVDKPEKKRVQRPPSSENRQKRRRTSRTSIDANTAPNVRQVPLPALFPSTSSQPIAKRVLLDEQTRERNESKTAILLNLMQPKPTVERPAPPFAIGEWSRPVNETSRQIESKDSLLKQPSWLLADAKPENRLHGVERTEQKRRLGTKPAWLEENEHPKPHFPPPSEQKSKHSSDSRYVQQIEYERGHEVDRSNYSAPSSSDIHQKSYSESRYQRSLLGGRDTWGAVSSLHDREERRGSGSNGSRSRSHSPQSRSSSGSPKLKKFDQKPTIKEHQRDYYGPGDHTDFSGAGIRENKHPVKVGNTYYDGYDDESPKHRLKSSDLPSGKEELCHYCKALNKHRKCNYDPHIDGLPVPPKISATKAPLSYLHKGKETNGNHRGVSEKDSVRRNAESLPHNSSLMDHASPSLNKDRALPSKFEDERNNGSRRYEKDPRGSTTVATSLAVPFKPSSSSFQAFEREQGNKDKEQFVKIMADLPARSTDNYISSKETSNYFSVPSCSSSSAASVPTTTHPRSSQSPILPIPLFNTGRPSYFFPNNLSDVNKGETTSSRSVQQKLCYFCKSLTKSPKCNNFRHNEGQAIEPLLKVLPPPASLPFLCPHCGVTFKKESCPYPQHTSGALLNLSDLPSNEGSIERRSQPSSRNGVKSSRSEEFDSTSDITDENAFAQTTIMEDEGDSALFRNKLSKTNVDGVKRNLGLHRLQTQKTVGVEEEEIELLKINDNRSDLDSNTRSSLSSVVPLGRRENDPMIVLRQRTQQHLGAFVPDSESSSSCVKLIVSKPLVSILRQQNNGRISRGNVKWVDAEGNSKLTEVREFDPEHSLVL